MTDKAQGDLQLLVRAADVLRRETERLRIQTHGSVKQTAIIRARVAHTRAVLEVQRLLRRLAPK